MNEPEKDPAMELMRFLKHCQVPDGAKATFTRMQGGKIYVPEDKQSKFLDLWSDAYPSLPPAFNLVPQVQKRKMPFTVDLDLFTKTRIVLGVDKLAGFATTLLDLIDNGKGRDYVILITRKDQPYKKTKQVGGEKVSGWKTGAHIYIANYTAETDDKTKLWNKRFTTRVRNHCYNEDLIKDFCEGMDLLEPICEVWDEGVAKRDQFPMLLGSEKPNTNNGMALRARMPWSRMHFCKSSTTLKIDERSWESCTTVFGGPKTPA